MTDRLKLFNFNIVLVVTYLHVSVCLIKVLTKYFSFVLIVSFSLIYKFYGELSCLYEVYHSDGIYEESRSCHYTTGI